MVEENHCEFGVVNFLELATNGHELTRIYLCHR